ncbi:MAG TPA: type VI secretion protein, partial [Stenotrophomonas sp.]|nr:type VI secretion protein [Stenotrophomonas sp.]
LLNIADQALSKVVLGSVDRMMQPQAQPTQGAAYPQQQAGGMPQQLPQQGPAQAMAMPQQLPGAAGAGNEGPVMLRPWSERNQPVAGGDNSFNAPVQAAPVQQIPAGDAAFVF